MQYIPTDPVRRLTLPPALTSIDVAAMPPSTDPDEPTPSEIQRLRGAQEVGDWQSDWPFDAWPEDDVLFRPTGP